MERPTSRKSESNKCAGGDINDGEKSKMKNSGVEPLVVFCSKKLQKRCHGMKPFITSHHDAMHQS